MVHRAVRSLVTLLALSALALAPAAAGPGAADLARPAPAGEDGPEAPPERVVVDALGREIRVLRGDEVIDTLPPPPPPLLGPDPSPAPCPPPGEDGVARTSGDETRSVDACGNVTGTPATPRDAPAPRPTIDRMTTWYPNGTHVPGGPLALFGSAELYGLSDGSYWRSGGSLYSIKSCTLDHVEVDGTTVRYVLRPPPDGEVYRQTDYDAGETSAQGALGTTDLLVLEATIGSPSATMRGTLRVLSNDPTWYGERFDAYSTVVGSRVPFELTYTLLDDTWEPHSFEYAFRYETRGLVDFAHPMWVPPLTSLRIRGARQVPEGSRVPYAAVAGYEGGFVRNVSALASWSVFPPDLARVEGGVLEAGSFPTDPQPLLLHATYTEGGTTLSAQAALLGRPAGVEQGWPMFQVDARHTGYLPAVYEPETFTVRWSRSVAPGKPLQPVATGDGRVFVSLASGAGGGPALFALDAAGGELLWSRSFGFPTSINPPSWAHGLVYLQSVNGGNDTWLHAFDAETGEPVFRSPHAAQGVRYYAPTAHDGSVYVNGGYYGGMYAFDAFSGARRWFVELPQYDQWTPGVQEDRVYAYVGQHKPGLYVRDRRTGAGQAFIPDPEFGGSTWSMNLAPVVTEDGDVLAIQNQRLLRFDLQGGSIAWTRRAAFTGQPSLARGLAYAVDGRRVVALDAETGTEAWAWTPPSGTPRSPLAVTESHLFVSTEFATYAVDLLARRSTWNYPVSGKLALGDGNLYVAQANGILVAIAADAFLPTPPASLEIRGSAQVVEFASASYRAFVTYGDGRVRERTLTVRWSVDPPASASIDAAGVLQVGEMLVLEQDATVRAAYEERGTTVESAVPVRFVASVTLPEFVERNRATARDLQVQAGVLVEEALVRETALLRALGVDPDPDPSGPGMDPFVAAVVRAMRAGRSAAASAQAAVDQLELAGTLPLPGQALPLVPARRGALSRPVAVR